MLAKVNLLANGNRHYALRNTLYQATKATRNNSPIPRKLTTTVGGNESKRQDKLMGTWLLSTAGLTFGMISLGGLTRLTRSGLSMTSWSFAGKLPPMNEKEWIDEFEEYKKFPEYQKLNRHFTLDDFKYIYYMEYAHRMYGRMLGLFYAIPLSYFLVSKRASNVSPTMPRNLTALLGLGVCQAFIGWWMVKSGLKEEDLVNHKEPRVSPYRLTSHLAMATTLYTGLLYSGLTCFKPNYFASANPRVGLVTLTGGVIITTLFSGAFVAGNDAGRAFNDWPLYNGDWVPEKIWRSELGVRNFFENTSLVQFDHRSLAYSTLFLTSVLGYQKRHFRMLPMVAWLQAGLGIITLMNIVPVSLGVLHQMGALIVWSKFVYLFHGLRYIK